MRERVEAWLLLGTLLALFAIATVNTILERLG